MLARPNNHVNRWRNTPEVNLLRAAILALDEQTIKKLALSEDFSELLLDVGESIVVRKKVIKFLLGCDIPFSVIEKGVIDPLHHAAAIDDPKLVTYLIGLGIDPNGYSRWDKPYNHWNHVYTPFLWAVIHYAYRSMTALVKGGANVNIYPSYQHSPLYVAVSRRRKFMVTRLLELKCKVETETIIESLKYEPAWPCRLLKKTTVPKGDLTRLLLNIFKNDRYMPDDIWMLIDQVRIDGYFGPEFVEGLLDHLSSYLGLRFSRQTIASKTKKMIQRNTNLLAGLYFKSLGIPLDIRRLIISPTLKG